MSVHFGNEEVCTVSADGIIISTPLGSTGYGMSAGGSIILDSKDILQLTPISPVRSSAYQSLSTPIIFNDNNDVTIFPSYKKQRIFRIVCDGKEIRTNQIRYVDIKKSDKVLRILRSKNYSTTKNIKNKILDEE
jgi:NAD+ kinase